MEEKKNLLIQNSMPSEKTLKIKVNKDFFRQVKSERIHHQQPCTIIKVNSSERRKMLTGGNLDVH